MSTKFILRISLITLFIAILMQGFTEYVVASEFAYEHQINQFQTRASYNLIAALKEKLKEKGYYKGEINGEYDRNLDDALYEYREVNGLRKDNSLKKTLKSLGLINGN